MVQIIEACAIKSTNNIHYIIEDDRLVERSLLWDHSSRVNLCPFSVLNFVGKEIIESLLARVDSSENENGFLKCDC